MEGVRVAERAVPRQTTINAVRVALTAGDEAVRTGESEARLIMEEGAW